MVECVCVNVCMHDCVTVCDSENCPGEAMPHPMAKWRRRKKRRLWPSKNPRARLAIFSSPSPKRPLLLFPVPLPLSPPCLPAMSTFFPWCGPTRMPHGCQKSCCNKRKSRPSLRTLNDGCENFRPCRPWQRLILKKSIHCGPD